MPNERQRIQQRVAGFVLTSESDGVRSQIEPRGDAEETDDNLGLDDIPRVKVVEWILLAACEERIRGRSLTTAEREGQER